MSEPGRSFACVVTPMGELRPVDEDRARALLSRAGQRIQVREVDAGEQRREKQNNYWWGVIVEVYRLKWQAVLEERHGYVVTIPPGAVHAKLLRIFGHDVEAPVTYETPWGDEEYRPSSRVMSVRRFSRLIDDAREAYWHEYGEQIPSPDEWTEAA